MKKRFLAVMTALIMVFFSFPLAAHAMDHALSPGNYNLSSLSLSSRDTITLSNGDYMLNGSYNLDNIGIRCTGNVELTLNNVNIDDSGSGYNGVKIPLDVTGTGNYLEVNGTSTLTGYSQNAAINVNSGAELTILGSGTLNATGGEYAAGIGSGKDGVCGDITIAGGTVNATGGGGDAGTGAGIGSGRDGTGGSITISGGIVNATGGSSEASAGAGIGSGNNSASGSITISGGTINAKGGRAPGRGGAGIGAGYDSSFSSIRITDGDVTATSWDGSAAIGGTNSGSNNGTISIEGGTVIANGGGGPGIGAADGTPGKITVSGGDVTASSDGYGAGIGGGLRCNGGVTEITGGTVKASGRYGGAGIGGGASGGAGGTVTVSGGTVYASAGENALDIGHGESGAPGSLGITGNAKVFLRHNSSDTATTTHKHVTASGFTSGGSFYGATVDWSGSFGAYMPLYAINYHYQNGGSAAGTGYTNLDGSATLADGDDLAADSITFTGYHLTEWNLVPNGSGTTYAPGSAQTFAADTDLYGQWIVNHYTVRFDKNKGTGSDMADESYTYAVSNPLSANTYTRDGYTFGGWTLTADGAVEYADKADASNLAAEDGSTVTFYAKWVPIPYTIGYNLGGGNAANPDGYNIESEAITLANPTRTGYAFSGWTGTDISAASTAVTIPKGSTGNRTYTAAWLANAYTVRFDKNRGAGSGMADEGFTYDVSKALSANTYTRDGYTFGGWALTPDGDAAYADKASALNLTADAGGTVMLYARWVPIPYTIGYDLGGGKATTANPDGYNIESNAITLANPTRTGYAFSGWTGTGISGASTSVTIPKGSMGNRTYTATWLENGYTVKFNPNGGSAAADQAVRYGAKIAKPKDPTREGFNFMGWYADAALSHAWDFNADTVKGDTTLYAKWASSGVYAICAKSSPAGGGRVSGTGKYPGGKNVTLKATPASGYRFVKWTEGGKAVSANAAYTFVSSRARALTACFAKIGTPASLAASSAGYNSAKVTWKAVDGAAGYNIYRSASKNGAYKKVGSSTGLSFTESGLACGKKVYYKVQAFCKAGAAVTKGALSTSAVATPVPATPVIMGLAAKSASAVKITYSKVTGASGYEVVRSARNPRYGYWFMQSTDKTAYTDGHLTKGVTYYYRVRAYRVVDGKKVFGAYSVIQSITL